MPSGLIPPGTGCMHGLLSEEEERLVGFRSSSLHQCEKDASPPPGAARITSGCCNVSMCLGARMISSWCPPSLGIRSGPKIRSGWCPRSLALVERNASPLRVNPLPRRGAMITNCYLIQAVSVRLGARMTSGLCSCDIANSFGA